jgi:hypothetical protein
MTVTDNDKPIIAEIEKQTDRAAALIAGAYLEERLKIAIQARTIRDTDVEKQIYRSSGPLGSFSAKIDMGLLLGIYEPQVHKMLHTVKDIRNEFAHKAEPRDFNSQRIRDLSFNMNVSAQFELKEKNTGQVINIVMVPDGTPRTAFMNATKMLLLFLDMEAKQLPLRVPAPPVMPSLASMQPPPAKP